MTYAGPKSTVGQRHGYLFSQPPFYSAQGSCKVPPAARKYLDLTSFPVGEPWTEQSLHCFFFHGFAALHSLWLLTDTTTRPHLLVSVSSHAPFVSQPVDASGTDSGFGLFWAFLGGTCLLQYRLVVRSILSPWTLTTSGLTPCSAHLQVLSLFSSSSPLLTYSIMAMTINNIY